MAKSVVHDSNLEVSSLFRCGVELTNPFTISSLVGRSFPMSVSSLLPIVFFVCSVPGSARKGTYQRSFDAKVSKMFVR